MIDTDAANNTEYFRLHPNCKIVKGAKYSAIYDLQRRNLVRFPTEYYEILKDAQFPPGISAALFEASAICTEEMLKQTLKRLESLGLGMFCKEEFSNSIRPIEENFGKASNIINSIIDFKDVVIDWKKIVSALKAERCRALQIRSFSDMLSQEEVLEILDFTQKSSIVHVELIIKWDERWKNIEWSSFFQKYRNLLSVIIHTSPYNNNISGDELINLADRFVRYQTKPILSESNCGNIKEGNMMMPTHTIFSELQEFQGCLNKKVSVRSDGEICNCPAMKSSFGQDYSNLSKVIKSEEFQEVWHLGNSKIEECKVCEFRLVCTGCRAFLNSDLDLSKPSRCNYNPATGKWV
ncbi:grasp-with-spasm system SPASM domain peptide maturase [Hellea sp.]|nr:grasp-with-spasm system SPASM domain peptide maturase [Hellea sp.]